MIEGGKASAGPPLGPTLAPLGVNLQDIVKSINDKTKDFNGMTMPVTVTVDSETKQFEIKVKTPPTSQLIKKSAGIKKGRKEKDEIAGNVTIEQIIEIANTKKDASLGKTLKDISKEVIGTCLTMGVTVEGKDPRDVINEINKGTYDAKIQ